MTERPPGPGHRARSGLPTHSSRWQTVAPGTLSLERRKETRRQPQSTWPGAAAGFPFLQEQDCHSSSVRTAWQRQHPGHLHPAPAPCNQLTPGACRLKSQVQLLTEDEAARLVEAPGGNKEEFLLCLGETYPIPPKALRDLAPPGPGESPTGARPPCQRHR